MLACLDNVALQLLQFTFARMDNAACTFEGNKSRRAEFRELFDQKLSPIAFGQGSGHFQPERKFPIRAPNFFNVDQNALLLHCLDPTWVFVAVSVEKANEVVGAKSTYLGKMVSLRSRQFGQSRVQRQVEVKSFGHLC